MENSQDHPTSHVYSIRNGVFIKIFSISLKG